MRRLLPVLPLLLLFHPAAASAAGETLTLTLDHPTVVWHGAVTASGDVVPAAPGLPVTGAVAGRDVGTAATDAGGHFTVAFTASAGGDVVARLATAAASAPVALQVTPRVKVRVRSAVAYRGAKLEV